MTTLGELLAAMMAMLEQTDFCRDLRILETSPFSSKQFAFKIRVAIFSSLTFQIRLYYTHGHCDYSYQVFADEPLCRWDNADHFPDLSTFPHHHHAINGEVVASPLTGIPQSDLLHVLAELQKLFAHDSASS